MRLLFKENENINYAQYEFPYCVYAIKEKNDLYTDIYKQGFLPYTNDFSISREASIGSALWRTMEERRYPRTLGRSHRRENCGDTS